jgi:hypothetical protein
MLGVVVIVFFYSRALEILRVLSWVAADAGTMNNIRRIFISTSQNGSSLLFT